MEKGFYPALYVFVMMTLVTGVIWQMQTYTLEESMPDVPDLDVSIPVDLDESDESSDEQEGKNNEKSSAWVNATPVEALKLPISDGLPFEQATQFYDPEADEASQLAGLNSYHDQYYQSTGIALVSINDVALPVVAALSGTVTSVKDDPLLGGVVELTHAESVQTYYAGLHDIAVEKDQTIKQFNQLDEMGESPFRQSLKSHVHFEVRVNNIPVNPNLYFDESVIKLQDVTADESFDTLPTEETNDQEVKGDREE